MTCRRRFRRCGSGAASETRRFLPEGRPGPAEFIKLTASCNLRRATVELLHSASGASGARHGHSRARARRVGQPSKAELGAEGERGDEKTKRFADERCAGRAFATVSALSARTGRATLRRSVVRSFSRRARNYGTRLIYRVAGLPIALRALRHPPPHNPGKLVRSAYRTFYCGAAFARRAAGARPRADPVSARRARHDAVVHRPQRGTDQGSDRAVGSGAARRSDLALRQGRGAPALVLRL